ncbi:hypothetical protein DRV04_23495 [Salmonella enterica subsp. enterica]|nr:hypothetical protein [Salmonella enterica subsp. enterica serovar Napoli]EDH3425287.1 DUF1493 family protein [Salmonella enterica]EJM8158848.1 DUF1493 family protein [Salmonella enterica]ELH5954434.1 DUF1493 family protein [Salmonella enterica]MLU48642.1 hypothetical protein [Salmonella enterica subsp. enterica serovar Napoli]
MVSDTLEQRIYELVRSHDGIYLFKKKELTPSTDLDSHLLNPFRKNDIPQVPDFTIGMLIESARAGRWLYD